MYVQALAERYQSRVRLMHVVDLDGGFQDLGCRGEH